jgi:hypothetical protein
MTYGHSAGIESRNSDLDGEPGEGTGSDQSLRAGFWARGGGGDVQVVRAFVQSLDGEAFLEMRLAGVHAWAGERSSGGLAGVRAV